MAAHVVSDGGITRRQVLRGGVALAATGLLAACSSGGGAEEERADRDAPGPTTTRRGRPGQGGGTVLVRNVRVFDGEEVVDADSLMVEGGLITAIGRGMRTGRGVEVHDGEGGFLLPGLIDAHGHTSGVDMLADSLRFGVTTVLDMFSPIGADEVGASLRTKRHELAATDQADFWSTGFLATAPGGHGTQFGIDVPVLAPGDDPDAYVAARAAEGADYLKIVIEDGSQFGRALPTLSADQVRGLVEAAHDRDLLAVVHTTTWAAAGVAADAGADVLAHAPDDELPDDGALRRVVAGDLAVIATVSVRVAAACADDAVELRDDPLVADLLSDGQRAGLSSTYPSCSEGRIETAIANTRALHEAGLPILAGSDYPNAGTAPGPTILLEVEMLTRAGLDPIEALRSATSLPARTFGLDDRGRLEVGRRGDLLLTRADPLDDMTTLRDIAAIWKNGFEIDRSAPPRP
jgi:imidazolonepropionase-like amidohydrolase